MPAIDAGLSLQNAGRLGAQFGLPSKCIGVSVVTSVETPVSSEFFILNAPLVKMPSTKATLSPSGE